MGEGKENMLYSVFFRISLRSSTEQSLSMNTQPYPAPSVADDVLVGSGYRAVEFGSGNERHDRKLTKDK